MHSRPAPPTLTAPLDSPTEANPSSSRIPPLKLTQAYGLRDREYLKLKVFSLSTLKTSKSLRNFTVSYKNATVKKALSETFEINVANIRSPYLFGVDYETDAYVCYGGAAVSWDLGSHAIDGYSVSNVTGLPAGIKFNAKTGLIEGVPTRGGTFTATIALKNGNEKSSATLTMNVEAIPTWAYGTFNGGSQFGQGQVTISSSGKISGKYFEDGITYTFSAPSFEWCENSNYFANITVSWSYKEGTTTVKCSDVACINLDEDGLTVRGCIDFDAYKNLWSQKDWKAFGVTQFGKSGTVKTLSGDDYWLGDDESITLTIKSTGAVTAKGKFCTYFEDRQGNPIYYTASASAVVCASEIDPFVGYVYLYFAPNASKGFAGYACEVELE